MESDPNSFLPRPEHKFTFGLWTVGNRGRDPRRARDYYGAKDFARNCRRTYLILEDKAARSTRKSGRFSRTFRLVLDQLTVNVLTGTR
jgi:hypothetical protein